MVDRSTCISVSCSRIIGFFCLHISSSRPVLPVRFEPENLLTFVLAVSILFENNAVLAPIIALSPSSEFMRLEILRRPGDFLLVGLPQKPPALFVYPLSEAFAVCREALVQRVVAVCRNIFTPRVRWLDAGH